MLCVGILAKVGLLLHCGNVAVFDRHEHEHVAYGIADNGVVAFCGQFVDVPFYAFYMFAQHLPANFFVVGIYCCSVGC